MKCIGVIFVIFIAIVQIKGRKYDIEAEAMKLYGENLDTVVQRFRKTPDYKNILNEKLKESDDTIAAIIAQTEHIFSKSLERKIKDSLPKPEPQQQSKINTPGNAENSFLRSYGRRYIDPYEHVYGMRQNILRQEGEGSKENISPSPIEVLDYIWSWSSYLTVAEKNHYKDMAFQHFGNAIHAIIKGMGPEEESKIRSTRQIIDSGAWTTTTEHPLITVERSTRLPQPDSLPPIRVHTPSLQDNIIRHRRLSTKKPEVLY